MSDGDPTSADYLGYLLELRLRCRRSPAARALVDRCLALIVAAERGEADDTAIRREIANIANDLALRFGAPATASIQ